MTAETHIEVPLLMTPEQVARVTGLSTNTLQNQRVKKAGLPFVKLGATVRYRAADVLAFIEKNTVQPLSPTG